MRADRQTRWSQYYAVVVAVAVAVCVTRPCSCNVVELRHLSWTSLAIVSRWHRILAQGTSTVTPTHDGLLVTHAVVTAARRAVDGIREITVIRARHSRTQWIALDSQCKIHSRTGFVWWPRDVGVYEPAAVKERKGRVPYLYSAFYILCISQSAQAWIAQFYLQIHHACLSFVSVHQMAPPLTEVRDIQLQLTTHLSTTKGWKTELAWLFDL